MTFLESNHLYKKKQSHARVDSRARLWIIESMKTDEIFVSAPGRICLFGEHQDYFSLPIIAAAINLRIFIRGKPRNDRFVKIDLPDLGEMEEFSLEKELSYEKERDYLRSAVNILRRKGLRFDSGWECQLHGTIPINAGTSSSSALVIAWTKFLLEAAGNKSLNFPEQIAELGFLTEVAEFHEPGGKMDHYASALGGIVNVSFEDELRVRKLKNPLKRFVLANSLQKKDTTGMLGYIKSHVLEGMRVIREKIEDFDLKRPLGEREKEEIQLLPRNNSRLLMGTLLTRDFTVEGKDLFEEEEFDHKKFGELLTRQHKVLRDFLQTSTPKIDKMLDAALAAGALGGKLNGSGGGGCMFAYAPEKTEQVAEAIEKIGAKVHIIHVDEGVRKEEG
jgi:galactokinase